MSNAREVAKGIAKPTNGRRGARGSVDNAGRLSAFAGRAKQGTADWGDCDSKWLQAVVVRITGMGGAVTFAMSRDQGAHSITLMLDNDRQTLWFNGDADLDNELEQVVAVLDSM